MKLRVSRRLRRGAAVPTAPRVRVAAGDAANAVERYWSEHTVRKPPLDSPAASLEHLEWRFEQYPLFREMTGLWGDRSGEVVLDYGCGPGNDVVGLALFSGARRVIGIDVSQTALELAAQRVALHGIAPGQVDLIHVSEDSAAIPLESSSVDYLQSQGVLHHTTAPEPILAELNRVLRPGGSGCIMVYNRASVWLHLYVAYELMVLGDAYAGLDLDDVFRRSTDGPDCPISRAYDAEVFTGLCRQAGFDVEFLGGYLSRHELERIDASWPAALMDERLAAEHRDFLRDLRFDRAGLPMHGRFHAGIGGVYRLRKPAA